MMGKDQTNKTPNNCLQSSVLFHRSTLLFQLPLYAQLKFQNPPDGDREEEKRRRKEREREKKEKDK